jgi:hypothetical protein
VTLTEAWPSSKETWSIGTPASNISTAKVWRNMCGWQRFREPSARVMLASSSCGAAGAGDRSTVGGRERMAAESPVGEARFPGTPSDDGASRHRPRGGSWRSGGRTRRCAIPRSIWGSCSDARVCRGGVYSLGRDGCSRWTASELPLQRDFPSTVQISQNQGGYCTKCCTKITLVFTRIL